MHVTHELELFPDHSVTQLLFKEVKNAAELRQSAVEGKLNAALINPTMVSCFVVSSSSDLKTFTRLKVLATPRHITDHQTLFSFTAGESFPSAGSRQ